MLLLKSKCSLKAITILNTIALISSLAAIYNVYSQQKKSNTWINSYISVKFLECPTLSITIKGSYIYAYGYKYVVKHTIKPALKNIQEARER